MEMKIETKLKNYILLKYNSIRSFSKEAKIPYTTIISILDRGIRKASINSMIQICDVLNIDMLVSNEIVEKNSIDNSTVKNLIVKISCLNKEGQKKLMITSTIY